MSLLTMGEFIEMAIRDEDTGAAWYAALAEHARDHKVHDAFSRLADQERAHAARFRELLTEVGAFMPFEPLRGDYDDYLKALLTMRAFPEAKDAVSAAHAVADDREALDSSLRMEKETLLFYYEILSFIPKTHRMYVEDVMDEERGHIRELTKFLQ